MHLETERGPKLALRWRSLRRSRKKSAFRALAALHPYLLARCVRRVADIQGDYGAIGSVRTDLNPRSISLAVRSASSMCL